MDTSTIILTIVGAVFASTGFWTLIQHVIDLKSAKTKLLLCMASEVLQQKGMALLAKDSITTDEYEELINFFTAYHKAGGNGTAEKVVDEVKKKPIQKEVKTA